MPVTELRIKGYRSVLCLSCTLLAAVSMTKTAARPPKAAERTVVPRIARLLGIRVGFNGQKALERWLGPGSVGVGGHSNSRQVWRTRSPQGVIITDGFSTNRDGYVVEDLWWSLDKGSASVPVARRLPKSSGWMGKVDLGMKSDKVAALTKSLQAPHKENGVWTWTEKGYVRPSRAQLQDAYRKWTATLRFDHDRLVEIRVDCE